MDTFFSSGYLPGEEGVTAIVRETIKISQTLLTDFYIHNRSHYNLEERLRVIFQFIMNCLSFPVLKAQGPKVGESE